MSRACSALASLPKRFAQSLASSRFSSPFLGHGDTYMQTPDRQHFPHQDHELQKLQLENCALKREVETWKGAYEKLTSSLHKSNVDMNIIPLQQSDFPNVKYWYRHEWKEEKKATTTQNDKPIRGGTHASMGVNVSALFICDSEVALFELYYELEQDPLKWGAASHKVITHFNHHMVNAYGELAFCHDNWKAQFFATANYPAWRRKNPTRVVVKTEKDEEDLCGNSNSGPAGKRCASEMEGGSDGTANADSVQPPAKKKNPGKTRRRPKLMSLAYLPPKVINPFVQQDTPMLPPEPRDNNNMVADNLASIQMEIMGDKMEASSSGMDKEVGNKTGNEHMQVDSPLPGKKFNNTADPFPSTSNAAPGSTHAAVPESTCTAQGNPSPPHAAPESSSTVNQVQDPQDKMALELDDSDRPMPMPPLTPPPLSNDSAPTSNSVPVSTANFEQGSGSITASPGTTPLVVNAVNKAPSTANKFKPSHSTTARNLCGIKWAQRVGGSSKDFAAYWKSIVNTPEAECFKLASKAAMEAASEAASGEAASGEVAAPPKNQASKLPAPKKPASGSATRSSLRR
ncbi:hypothetical protein BDP27DRAFT_1365264 [Rhodocollybia butyracea]|uniref:Uncharacterized protein n=1 Tax=Rhodocollybia butyracea TaxID=206335 RepID=A0A9P5PN23_9AGAR|nr:hypothetical protein BDP27DRAFT_1365264 [Rhodocollybia butyracea]